MIRSGRTSGQARKAAMERVRIFASQGRSHLAEMEINDLLSGGVPVSEVCKVLNGLPYGIPPDLAPRREALQRSAALLAGGALIGARMRSPRSSGAAGSGSPLPGLFTTTPLAGAADETFTICQVTGKGLRKIPGAYRGFAFAEGGTAYVVSQSWVTGTPVTITDLITPDGDTNRLITAVRARSDHADTIGAIVTACKRGAHLFVASTWIRTYSAAEQEQGRTRVTSQPGLQVIDSAGGSLVAAWTGREETGERRTSLKVSGDGRGIVVSTGTTIRRWIFDGAALHASSAVEASADLIRALGRRDCCWPTWNSELIQAGDQKVYAFSLPAGTARSCDLPPDHQPGSAPCRVAHGDPGSLVVSSGDGHYLLWRPYSQARPRTLPHDRQRRFMVYSGQALRDIFARTGSSVWLIDNREGSGGIWRLDPGPGSGTGPGSGSGSGSGSAGHILPGTYFSGCAADTAGGHVAAVSGMESALYVISANGDVRAFAVPSGTVLMSGS